MLGNVDEEFFLTERLNNERSHVLDTLIINKFVIPRSAYLFGYTCGATLHYKDCIDQFLRISHTLPFIHHIDDFLHKRFVNLLRHIVTEALSKHHDWLKHITRLWVLIDGHLFFEFKRVSVSFLSGSEFLDQFLIYTRRLDLNL